MENREEALKVAQESAEQKAIQLSETRGQRIHSIVLFFKDKFVTGYYKEPSRLQKIAMLDRAVMGGMAAAAEVYEVLLLKEESDTAFYSENQEYDQVFIGAVKAVYDSVKMSIDQAKKKS